MKLNIVFGQLSLGLKAKNFFFFGLILCLLLFLLLFQYSIVAEERLERLVRGISDLDLEASDGYRKEENLDDMPLNHRDAEDMQNRSADISQSNLGKSTSGGVASGGSDVEHQMLEGDVHFLNKGANDNGITPIDTEPEMIKTKGESDGAELKDCHIGVDNCSTNKQAGERCLPNAVLPLLRYYQYESSESSPRYVIAVL